jgi:hypothetical protein
MQSTDLIDDIEAFLKRNNLSATRFGVLAAGDTKFVKTLREGRAPRASTVERVRNWMQQQAEA